MSYKIQCNDLVIVITGKDKGKTGVVKKIYHHINKVIVEGINVVKKHQKPSPEKKQIGGIVTKELPIHISNISHFNKVTNKADKIKFLWDSGKKVRCFKSTQELLK